MKPSILAHSHANDLREELGLKENDTVGDIVQLKRDIAGYEYEEAIYSEPYYGCSEYKGSGKFKISYNLQFNWNEAFKRFTLAHELGHISLHHEYLREHILHRCYTQDQFIKQMEVDADCFAGNFLAPQKLCYQLISQLEFTPLAIKQIAEHFNISTYAAALRFIEVTDLTCLFIVCNKNGKTDYERRSSKMEMEFKHSYIYKTKIHPHTLTYEYINGKQDQDCCESQMNYWHTDLPKIVLVKECVLDLAYNDKFMTLITPQVGSFDEFLKVNDDEI
jgi:hypothetical protein